MQLKHRCFQKSAKILAEVGAVHTGKSRAYGYRDNGADVLAVAHVDTVQTARTWDTATVDNLHMVFNPQLDDRLGVYAILDHLPRLGIAVDVLLTDLEEIAQSTASDFTTAKEYNWLAEFDRCGSDAVLYDYQDIDWEDCVSEHFKVGMGSYSDICNLEHLGVKALNVGIGYHNEHGPFTYGVLREYAAQMQRFCAFYAANHGTKYPHEPLPDLYNWGSSWRAGTYYDHDPAELVEYAFCPGCNEGLWVDDLIDTKHALACPLCGCEDIAEAFAV